MKAIADECVGGKCGSTALDRNFYKLMSDRFGSAFDDLPLKRKGPGSVFMNHFESLKKDFGVDLDETVHELTLNLQSSDVDTRYYDADDDAVLLTT